jgi:hypothetical protein
MDCREALPLISPYLDGELADNKQTELLEHTAGCKACAYELILQEHICKTLKNMGNEIQAPPGLCSLVMQGVAGQRRGILRVLSPRLQRAIAVAATVLVMAGGSAGLTVATLKTDAGSKVIGYYTSPPSTIEPAQNTNPLPEDDGNSISRPVNPVTPVDGESTPGFTGNGTGAEGSTGTGENSEEPQVNASPGIDTNNGIFSAAATSEVDGPRVFLNNTEVKINSTMMKIAVDELDAAKTRALSLAIDSGAVAHVYPKQDNGKNLLYMRIKVTPEQAPRLIEGLSGLGLLVDRQDETRDITSLYNETMVNYNSIIYQKDIEQDNTVKQQLEAQASSYKQQLDTWAEEASNRVINLWLESEN